MALSIDAIKRRRETIGGSDIPIILGISKYKTPRELFAEKSATHKPEPSEDDEVQKWGHRLEPLIVQAWGEARGIEVSSWVSGPLVHPTIPWATCTPDGGVVFRLAIPEGVSDPGGFGIEAKNRAYENGWGPSDTEEIPADVEAQVRWSMFVSGCDRWGVGVLLGGNQFRHYLIRRDETWESYVFPIVEAFRAGDFIEKPGDWTPVTSSTKRTALDAETKLISEWLVARTVRGAADAQFKHYDRDLRAAIGGSLGLISPAGTATLSPCKGKQVTDWEAVARALSGRVPPEEYASYLTSFTTEGKPYRRLTVRPAPPSEGKDAVK